MSREMIEKELSENGDDAIPMCLSGIVGLSGAELLDAEQLLVKWISGHALLLPRSLIASAASTPRCDLLLLGLMEGNMSDSVLAERLESAISLDPAVGKGLPALVVISLGRVNDLIVNALRSMADVEDDVMLRRVIVAGGVVIRLKGGDDGSEEVIREIRQIVRGVERRHGQKWRQLVQAALDEAADSSGNGIDPNMLPDPAIIIGIGQARGRVLCLSMHQYGTIGSVEYDVVRPENQHYVSMMRVVGDLRMGVVVGDIIVRDVSTTARIGDEAWIRLEFLCGAGE